MHKAEEGRSVIARMGYSNGVFQSQRSKRERKIVYVSRSNPENQVHLGSYGTLSSCTLSSYDVSLCL